MRIFSCVILLLGLAAGRAEPCKIFDSTAGGLTFYHIEFTLTASNSSIVVPPSYQNSQWRPESMSMIRGDGMFEIFIRADEFPIPSSRCKGGWIVLRMPSTAEGAEGAKRKIEEKKALWKNLQKIYISKSGSQRVVIELNPYVRVLDPAGPKLELEFCNVFFRHAHGSYVPYVGPLETATNTGSLKRE